MNKKEFIKKCFDKYEKDEVALIPDTTEEEKKLKKFIKKAVSEAWKESVSEHRTRWAFKTTDLIEKEKQEAVSKYRTTLIEELENEAKFLALEDFRAKVTTLTRRSSDIRSSCYIAGLKVAKKIIEGNYERDEN